MENMDRFMECKFAVYFNSRKIEVITQKDADDAFHATMSEPFKKLHNREVPNVDVQMIDNALNVVGTEIIIYSYNNNRRDKFTHEILKDYIMWFTKHGAIDNQFNLQSPTTVLYLKGLGKDKDEKIERGHCFPPDSQNINKLFETHITKAPDYYSKKVIKTGHLKNFPEINYHAIFCIEGKYVKYLDLPQNFEECICGTL